MPDDKEDQYSSINDDARRTRRQLDILTGKVGELVSAIKGDELGNEGILGQIKAIRQEMTNLELRMEIIETHAAQAKIEARIRHKYMKIAYTLGGGLGVGLLKYFIDHIIPYIKHP